MSLDDLIPQPRLVSVGGRDVSVDVLRMRQVPGFSKAVAKPWGLIVTGDFMGVVMQCPDEAMTAMQIATGVDAAFLDDLRPDEFLTLATAVFEVNLSFFAQAVLPAARAMAAALSGAMTTSSPSSSDLSAPGTDTTTSSDTASPN